MTFDRGTSQLEPSDVTGWRRRKLIDAGVDGVVANRLAGEPDFDVHALLELIGGGCPPQLAARILAPLEPSWDTGA